MSHIHKKENQTYITSVQLENGLTQCTPNLGMGQERTDEFKGTQAGYSHGLLPYLNCSDTYFLQKYIYKVYINIV